MRNFIFFALPIAFMSFIGCSEAQVTDQPNSTIENKTIQSNLSATEFDAKLKSESNPQLIDVRTPQEFEQGHLMHASNINWKDSNFGTQISSLDKTKPVYVYCLSGNRSSSAAAKMRSDGFTEVYELSGGITAWRNAKLPEITTK